VCAGVRGIVTRTAQGMRSPTTTEVTR